MPITTDLKRTYERFRTYIEELEAIFNNRGITRKGLRRYLACYQLLSTDEQVRGDVAKVLRVVAALEGGKMSLGTVGAVLGLAIGGVGIAATGTAVGLPGAVVAVLSTLAGGLLGQELDSAGETAALLTSVGLPSASVGPERMPKSLPPPARRQYSPNNKHEDLHPSTGGTTAGDSSEPLRALSDPSELVENALRQAATDREAHAREARANANRAFGRLEAIKSDLESVTVLVRKIPLQVENLAERFSGLEQKISSLNERIELVQEAQAAQARTGRKQLLLSIGCAIVPIAIVTYVLLAR